MPSLLGINHLTKICSMEYLRFFMVLLLFALGCKNEPTPNFENKKAPQSFAYPTLNFKEYFDSIGIKGAFLLYDLKNDQYPGFQ